jgi:hypothetical protein
MNSLTILLTPLALLLPAAVTQWPEDEKAAHSSPREEVPAGLSVPPVEPLQFLEDARRPVENQVRIEQRVIVRIAPSSRQFFARSVAALEADADSFEEVRLHDCVPINMIAAVYPQEHRLLLFMRDRQVLTATLERSCSPEDFYSGFYIERQDGQLCEKRDELKSRAGASCKVNRLSRLVAARD